MESIIQLLPDAVANQIAAGEVVQRPASVVKELLENAIDAEATQIKLIVKNAGKSLIQIIDDGKGMNETDLRLSIERHATSKIKSADDLFYIKSFGFRGEALASIAAIAQLEIKSRTKDDEVASSLIVEATDVKGQEYAQGPPGTSITVQNLFFNTPARRRFLKSDPVELRHIIDEFHRVAIPNFHIGFYFYHNDELLFQLPPANLKQRLLNIFGKKYNHKLAPLNTHTDFVKVTGFIGTPDTAKKTRGEQFFFVNNRFIKNAYLNHAVQSAFEALIPKSSYATYFIMLDVDPATIDVNIHPTKTEIKFQNERSIYAVVNASTKEAIGKHNLSPSLDFETEMSMPPPSSNRGIEPPGVYVNPEFNPFENKTSQKKSNNITAQQPHKSSLNRGWEAFFKSSNLNAFDDADLEAPKSQQIFSLESEKSNEEAKDNKNPFQLSKQFIVSSIKSGLLIIDQKKAHERILYEKFIKQLALKKGLSQTELFPQNFELSPADSDVLSELLDEFKQLGLHIHRMGQNIFNLTAKPIDLPDEEPKQLVESLLECHKNNQAELMLDKNKSLALAMAQNAAVKYGQLLQKDEMSSIIDMLFACESPYISPSGKSTLTVIGNDEILKRLNQ